MKVLFIDDDGASNFLNRHIAKSNAKVTSIYLVDSGFSAISFLKESINNSVDIPDLIFLDINMPAMNGWEFLDKFLEFDKKIVDEIKVVILSSSDDPNDLNKFNTYDRLVDFIRKPLNKDNFGKILQKVIDAREQ